MTSPSISGGFSLPFDEQIRFFRAKLNLPTEHWDDVWQSAHDRAFVVAGATKADLLDDLRQAVDKAISTGTSLDTFRKDFKALVAKNGWTGWTGENSAAGTAWRTKVIYETNLRSSYAAGRYAQLTDPKLLQLMPYWRYVHNDSVMNPRPLHLAWNGLTLRYDHEFWKTHFCPNGWGCRCRIVAVAAPRPGDATVPPPGWNTISEKTGAPIGIDKGWAYAPGASVADQLKAIVDTKVSSLPKPLADALAKDVDAVINPPASLDEFIQAGQVIRARLPDAINDPAAFLATLLKSVHEAVGTDVPAVIATQGPAAKTMAAASRRLPNSWTRAADGIGSLSVKGNAKARAWHWTADKPGRVRLSSFGIKEVAAGDGFIVVRPDDLSVCVHEFAHRIQAALPALDSHFQALHQRRTAGESAQRLSVLTGLSYGAAEVAKPDHWIDPYWGKVYPHKGALEVMSMALQSLLGGDLNMLKMVYTADMEVVDLTIGLLHYWKP